MKTAVVIGGGISGLATAHYLRKKGNFAKILVFEASSRLGGWLQSIHHPDGSVFELGPRSIRPAGRAGQNTLELTVKRLYQNWHEKVEELDLADQVLWVRAQNRYLYVNGEKCALPNSLGALLQAQKPFSRPLLSYLIRELFQKRSNKEDESIYDFMERRMGKEVACYAFDPLCRGIFAGDIRHLSIRSCFPELYKFEKQYGSVVKGFLFSPKDKSQTTSRLVQQARLERWSTYSFKTGVLQLVNALEESLQHTKGTEIHTDTPCSKLHFTSDGKLVVSVNGEEVKADHVFSSIYAKNLSQILSAEHSTLASELWKIPAVTVVVVCVEIDEKPSLNEPGFGHLLPSSEDGKLLGVVYDSCVFPQHDRQDVPSSRFTVMMGGAWYDELRGKSDEELQELALNSLFMQLGISGTVTKVKVALMKECIPQYLVGHHQLLERIFTYIQDRNLPLSLVGSSYCGPSINDCINNARLEVDRIPKLYC